MFSTKPCFPVRAAGITLLCASACLPATFTTSPDSHDDPLPQTPTAANSDLAEYAVLDQQRLTCAVLASNPELAAWHESWQAANARSRQPTSVGDTSLSYSFAPGSIGSDAFGQVVEIEQSFRLGQANLERRVARAIAEAAGHDVATKRQQLVFVTRTLFDEYYSLTRALETNSEHRELVTALLEVATARYSTGHAPQQDPIQAELEIAQIDHERVILQSQRDVVAAQINGLLHRPPNTALPPPPDRLVVASSDGIDQGWRRPETESAVAEEEAAEQARTLARRRFSPTVEAMGTYNSMWADVRHQFMLGVGISIPLQFRSLRAGIVEADAERNAARYQREAIEDTVAVEQAAAQHELERAQRVVELHRARLIPAARARIEAARAGYETGANDFSTVIEAERELRRLELGYHRALAELNDKVAELDHAVGRPPNCETGGTDQ